MTAPMASHGAAELRLRLQEAEYRLQGLHEALGCAVMDAESGWVLVPQAEERVYEAKRACRMTRDSLTIMGLRIALLEGTPE